MKNVEMARDYAFRAKRCVEEVELALSRGDFPGAVRRSQEALELGTKAMLRYLGIEYPKEHDVGDALPFVEDKLPQDLKEEIPKFRRLLKELGEHRGPALYGFEREGVPPTRIFSREYAEAVSRDVKTLLGLVFRFLKYE